METILNLLTENLALIVSGVIVPLVSWFIKKKVDNERLRQALIGLNEAVFTGVGHSAQTYVKAMREAQKDGKLTAAEKQEAKRRAINTAKAHLGPKLRKEAKKIFGDLDTVLSARVEAMIAEKKGRV